MFTVYKVNSQSKGMILRGFMNLFHKSLTSNKLMLSAKCLSQRNNDDSIDQSDSTQSRENSAPFSTLEKYKLFRDEDSPVILDIIEERFKALQQVTLPKDEYEGLNLKRGKDGVFDIEDIVELLRREKASNIFVVKVPQEFKYVNYLVIVSGKSVRHMKALAEFVRKVYKKKRYDTDPIPKIEGEDSKDWIALDLGNVALHVFAKSVRATYDLEALWAVGAELDELSRQRTQDALLQLLEKHTVYLGDLQPAARTPKSELLS